MKEHLAKNEVDLSKDKLTIGPVLKMDGKTERFIDHEAANACSKTSIASRLWCRRSCDEE
jgi:hypothetical protein